MEYIKQEDSATARYPVVNEGLIQHVVYQDEHHGHIRLDAQSAGAAALNPHNQNGLVAGLSHRSSPVMMQAVQRVNSGAGLSHMSPDLGLGPSEHNGALPIPFHIKAELEEGVYYYDQLMQTYDSNGTLRVEQSTTSGEPQPVQYVFNSNMTSIEVSTVPPPDAYVRQPHYLQEYVPVERGSNPEDLKVHRQYEVNYSAAEDSKSDRRDLSGKFHDPLTESHPNENTKPIENKMYYVEYDPSGGYGQPGDLKDLEDGAYRNAAVPQQIPRKKNVCQVCSVEFQTKHGLAQHTKVCRDESGRPAEKAAKFECKHCPYKCASVAILKIHERTHTGEKPFACCFCDYKSGQKNNVAKHLLVHIKEKPFQCQYCDYRCAQKNNLVVHERTHTGFKPFACTLCDYKTVQKPNLVKHMYLHTGQKPFGCDQCSYRCVQKTNLTKHKQRHEKGDGSGYEGKAKTRAYRPRQKSFKCELCPFQSVQKSGLDKHVQFKHIPEAKAESADTAVAGECAIDASFKPELCRLLPKTVMAEFELVSESKAEMVEAVGPGE